MPYPWKPHDWSSSDGFGELCWKEWNTRKLAQPGISSFIQLMKSYQWVMINQILSFLSLIFFPHVTWEISTTRNTYTIYRIYFSFFINFFPHVTWVIEYMSMNLTRCRMGPNYQSDPKRAHIQIFGIETLNYLGNQRFKKHEKKRKQDR